MTLTGTKRLLAVSEVVLGLALLTVITACGGSSGSGGGQPVIERGTLKGTEYGVLDKGSLKLGEGNVVGTGTIIFTAPRTEQDNNYALGLSLNEGGSVTVVLHAENKLDGGMRVTFARPAGNSLKVTYLVGGQSYDFSSDYSTELAGVKADAPLNIEIDMHQHGDLIVELAGRKMGAEFKTTVIGKFWGVVLKNASVTTATMKKVKFPH